MSLLSTQNFLARLYTDENLRREFLSAPNRVGEANNLNEKQIAELAEILPVELNFFAESLFYKRFREAEKLLPLTKRVLAAEFENHFRKFANQFTPESIKKHLEDAIEFCKFLRSRKSVPEWAKDAALFEKAKLEFYGYEQRFKLKILDYDVREISRLKTEEPPTIFKRKKTLAIWLRVGKQTRHFIR